MKKYKTLKRSRILPLLIEFVQRHFEFKNCYFWTPPSQASRRRQMEESNELTIHFILNGTEYRFEQSVRCSCSNVYYRSNIEVNDKTKDIRAIKKLIQQYN